MSDRRGEKLGWTLGWLGGFVWVAILTAKFAFQGKSLQAASGLALTIAAIIIILLTAPWRHPQTQFWKLMIPVYLLVFCAITWGVWSLGDARQLGITSWWSALLFLPVLLPLWLAGRRRWDNRRGQASDAQP